ncbi:hypothetical protein MY11210_008903 [Beauveria gryllotalpidicola]
MLTHFSVHRTLFIDVDASKDGIGVMVYHVNEATLAKIKDESGRVTRYPPVTAIEPVAFLSRTLADVEKKYWVTEMEICGYVWAVRKTQH